MDNYSVRNGKTFDSVNTANREPAIYDIPDFFMMEEEEVPRQIPSRPSPIPSRVASPIPSRSTSPSQQLTYTRDQLMRLRDTKLSRAVPKDLPRTTEYTWGIDLFPSVPESLKKFRENGCDAWRSKPIIRRERKADLHKATHAWKPKPKNVEKNAELEATVKSFLNKLTAKKMDAFVKKIGEEAVKSEANVDVIAKMLHDKACIEYKFAALYAKFAKSLDLFISTNERVPPTNRSQPFISLIRDLCYAGLEKDNGEDGVDSDSETDKEKAYLNKLKKIHYHGNIEFSGELFKAGLVEVKVIKEGIAHLIRSPTEANVEYICQFLTDAGPEVLATDPSLLDSIFDSLKSVISTMRFKTKFVFEKTEKLRPQWKMDSSFKPKASWYRPRVTEQEIIPVKKSEPKLNSAASWFQKVNTADNIRISGINPAKDTSSSLITAEKTTSGQNAPDNITKPQVSSPTASNKAVASWDDEISKLLQKLNTGETKPTTSENSQSNLNSADITPPVLTPSNTSSVQPRKSSETQQRIPWDLYRSNGCYGKKASVSTKKPVVKHESAFLTVINNCKSITGIPTDWTKVTYAECDIVDESEMAEPTPFSWDSVVHWEEEIRQDLERDVEGRLGEVLALDVSSNIEAIVQRIRTVSAGLPATDKYILLPCIIKMAMKGQDLTGLGKMINHCIKSKIFTANGYLEGIKDILSSHTKISRGNQNFWFNMATLMTQILVGRSLSWSAGIQVLLDVNIGEENLRNLINMMLGQADKCLDTKSMNRVERILTTDASLSASNISIPDLVKSQRAASQERTSVIG